MLKKLFKLSVISITLFCFVLSKVNAYELVNPENEDNINDMITEIYDAKDQYVDLVGGATMSETVIYEASEDSYWWPIGSSEVAMSGGKEYAKGDPEALIITSEYGYRDDPFGRGKMFHSGLDISGGRGEGLTNVIAAKDGIVVYPTSKDTQTCPSSTSTSNCGGGYGNYVIIQHSDGNFTLYAHLYQNSILVEAGDSVGQGQVIAQMGSSGNSTGAHLHFEVREGQNNISAAVNPLDYISIDNPRSASMGGEFIDWLVSWEGHTPISGNNYQVVDIGDGVRTVGSGVTLEYNAGRFKDYGINVNDYPVGSYISIEIVDQIKVEIVNEKRSSVEAILANSSITLNEDQINALVSQTYNIGNISGFTEAYKRYGNTIDLYNNWFFRAVMKGTQFETGLTRRRNAEWAMFNTGEYVYKG